MKVYLFAAQTINGFIARESYSEDFLSDSNWEVFVKLAGEVGCLIIGRKTYEESKKWKSYSLDDINVQKIIISKNTKLKLMNDYIFADSPRNALDKASKLGFKKILLAGGGLTNSTFMKEKFVDEIIINIEPYLLGKGIRTFSEDNFENILELISVKKITSDIVQLRYKVLK